MGETLAAMASHHESMNVHVHVCVFVTQHSPRVIEKACDETN
jgi:hypothetical protein